MATGMHSLWWSSDYCISIELDISAYTPKLMRKPTIAGLCVFVGVQSCAESG